MQYCFLDKILALSHTGCQKDPFKGFENFKLMFCQNNVNGNIAIMFEVILYFPGNQYNVFGMEAPNKGQKPIFMS